MLTPKTVKLLGWSINYASRFNALPYKWDEEKNKLIHLPKIRWNLQYIPWLVTVFLVWCHTIFVLLRITYSELVYPSDRFMILILGVSYIIVNLLPSVLLLNVVFRKEEILSFVNRTIQLMLYIQGKFLTSIPNTCQRKRWEQLMKFVQQNTYVGPTTLLILMCQDPHRWFYVSSLVPESNLPSSLWVFAIFYYWIVLTLWAILIFHCYMCLMCLLTFHFLVSETRPRKKSKLTKPGLRKPKTAAFIYCCLQVLITQLNFCFDKVIMFLIGIVISLCILNLYAVGKIRHGFHKYYLISSTLNTIFMFLLTIQAFAIVYHSSGNLIKKWKIWRKKKSIVRIYWQSRRPLMLQMGPIHCIDYTTVLRIVTIITVTAGKLLIVE